MKKLNNSHQMFIQDAATGIIKDFKNPDNFIQFMGDAIRVMSRPDINFKINDSNNTSEAITFMQTVLHHWLQSEGSEVDRLTEAINNLSDFTSAEDWRNVLTCIQCAIMISATEAGIDKEYYYEIRNHCESLFEMVFALHQIEWEEMLKKAQMDDKRN